MSQIDNPYEAANEPAVKIELVPYRRPKVEDIPRREFLLGTAYQRGTVSITAAVGGAGKSTLALAEALHMIAGLPFNGRTPPRPLNVYLWNGEEDDHEINRRVAAAIDLFAKDAPDKKRAIESAIAADRLFIHSKGMQEIKLVEYRERTRVPVPDDNTVEALIYAFKALQIDVAIFDPLIKTHKVSEDDNPAMAFLVETCDRIAAACNCAVMLVPHTRKSKAESRDMTVDDIRGASSFAYAARFARMLNGMTPAQAERWNLDREMAWRYFRVDDVKRNYAQAARAEWYKLESVQIGNGELGGDSVGAAVGFTPPQKEEVKLAPTAISRIQSALLAEPERWRWSNNASGDLFITLVAKEVNIDTAGERWKETAKAVIKDLTTAGYVKKGKGKGNKNTVPVAQCGENRPRAVRAEVPEGEAA